MSQPDPHSDGDVLILGPEIFATPDRAVICWQGVTYVRQDAPTPEPSVTVIEPPPWA